MIRLPLLLVLSVAVIGCGSAKPDPQVAELKKQIAELSARIEQLESGIKPTALGDVSTDLLIAKTIMVIDENLNPRICLSADPTIHQAFQKRAAHPAILLETANNINANLTMTNADGKQVTRLSSYPGGGSGSFASAESGLGSLQLFSGSNGPELRRYEPDGEITSLKQIPVDNPETDFR